MIRAALITISTSRAEAADSGAEEVADLSGERMAEFAETLGAEVIGRDLIPDDFDQIVQRLTHWAGDGGAELILTSGGTGLAPSDVTPEATTAIIERPAPGIAEAVRLAASEHTSHWPLSRGVAGVRGRCLIINLPGSPRSISQSEPALSPILGHAIELLQGQDSDHS